MNPRAQEHDRKWQAVVLLAIAVLLAKSLWFSASAVVPQLTEEWQLTGGQQAWLTMSVQVGFVAGALVSALLTLSDVMPARWLFAASAAAGACFTAAIAFWSSGPESATLLRFMTGVTLAGVYPPGMKLMASWCKRDRGLCIGLLVGALAVGAGLPYLLSAMPADGATTVSWRTVLLLASSLAAASAVIAAAFIRSGPHLAAAPRFDWRYAGHTFSRRALRFANFGYLGHMWELYAMWAWLPLFLLASFQAAGLSETTARAAGFAAIAIGGPACIVAGLLADRWGRTRIASVSLAVSGSCALVAGFLFPYPGILTLVCLVWGFAVVADSAQFSAAISELADERYVGTALTMQTCLGFLLTLVTIRIVPMVAEAISWEAAFALLALGPAFGIWSMLRLRRLPEATRMASGQR